MHSRGEVEWGERRRAGGEGEKEAGREGGREGGRGGGKMLIHLDS